MSSDHDRSETNDDSPPRRRGPRLRLSTLPVGPLPKAALIGCLVLAMLVPLALVEEVITERDGRYRSVVQEIGALWGSRQQVRGPLLAVPFERSGGGSARQKRFRVAYFLPDAYRITGSLNPEVRRRGLFETPVYRASLPMEGSFVLPPVESWREGSGRILWDEARLVLGIEDPRSIGGGTKVDWNGREIAFEPGMPSRLAGGLRGGLVSASLSARVPGLSAAASAAPGQGRVPFHLSLTLNGSEGLDFLPLGRETEVSLKSSWPDPSFEGAYLPARREVSDAGFDADWSLSYFGRSYPQQWLDSDSLDDLPSTWDRSRFGVRLFQPVDAYHQAERSAKYGVLFLLYTFGALFLFELLGRLRLHIVHYLLVGLSLSLFYLLLLSLAEHLGFGPAYMIAAAAVVGQIGAFTWDAIGSRRRSLLFTALLAALYGALFGLMQVETYALVIGSVCLFLLLALVMVAARRIDWYGLDGDRSPA